MGRIVPAFIFVLLTFVAVQISQERARAQSEVEFPTGFLWGTAISAHQAEGGNVNNWSRWEQTPGHIAKGQVSGLAIDHWNRYETDYDYLTQMNANIHRLSVEWSRVEPVQGQWNESALQRYRQMVLSLRRRNIRPMVCLFHFTLPLWAEDKGGFENPEIMAAFLNFAKKIHEALGDVTHDWLTLNEPSLYTLGGYGNGSTPPGVKDLKRVGRVFANLMHIHGRVYHLIKDRDPGALVSLAHPMRAFSPFRSYNPLDIIGARVADDAVNWAWLRSIQTGQIKLSVPTQVSINEPCPECKDAIDYIGINYYTRDLIEVNPFGPQKLVTHVHQGPSPHTDLGWEIYPRGLENILRQLKARKFDKYPILMTENGLADADDHQRQKFIYDHLKIFLEVSKELGLKPMGYMHWSLIDNFEWLLGFGPRFGLIAVDYRTLVRTPRPSSSYFAEMGRKKKLLPPPL